MRDEERLARAREAPVVDGLPDLPGIIAAMNLAPALGVHLRGLANALLVEAFPGSTLRRGERELLATATSADNDCFYCMDTHGAFAAELLRRDQASEVEALIDSVKSGTYSRLDGKMSALATIARRVAQQPRLLSREDVAQAKAAGASDADVHLAILIAAAFCMYNRMVDGLRARTPSKCRSSHRVDTGKSMTDHRPASFKRRHNYSPSNARRHPSVCLCHASA